MNNEKRTYICYCDGSARPNPGYCGWGVHGYSFVDIGKDDKTKNKPQKVMITDDGYVEQDKYKSLAIATKNSNGTFPNMKLPNTVNPIEYYEWYGSCGARGTNNIAEQMAVNKAIEEIIGYGNAGKIKVFLDSQITLNNIKKVLEGDDWRGKVANEDLVSETNNLMMALKSMDIEFEYEYIMAHSGLLGNEISDDMANIGTIESRYVKKPTAVYNKFEPKEYWKPSVIKHPMLSFRNIIFNANDDSGRKDSDGGIYFTLNVKKIEEAGKPSTEASFGLVFLKDKIPELELVKNAYNSILSKRSVVSCLNVENLYKNIRMINTYKERCMTVENNNLKVLYNDVIANAVYPPGLAKNALKEYEPLKWIARSYIEMVKEGKYTEDIKIATLDNHVLINITDNIYDIDDKGNYKLKKEVYNDNKPVIYDYKNKDGYSFKMVMVAGLDILPKISLKKLEKNKPVITLYLNDNGNKLTYGTITENNDTDDIGIWKNAYSNVVYGIK